MKKLAAVVIGLGVALTMVLAIPGEASAFTSGYAYVCSTHHYPKATFPTKGNHGTLHVQLNSQPGCQGTVLGTGTIYSVGATHTDADPTYLYSEAGLTMLHNALQLALIHNQVVYVQNCSAYRPDCISRIVFRAMPAGTTRSSSTLTSTSK